MIKSTVVLMLFCCGTAVGSVVNAEPTVEFDEYTNLTTVFFDFNQHDEGMVSLNANFAPYIKGRYISGVGFVINFIPTFPSDFNLAYILGDPNGYKPIPVGDLGWALGVSGDSVADALADGKGLSVSFRGSRRADVTIDGNRLREIVGAAMHHAPPWFSLEP